MGATAPVIGHPRASAEHARRLFACDAAWPGGGCNFHIQDAKVRQIASKTAAFFITLLSVQKKSLH